MRVSHNPIVLGALGVPALLFGLAVRVRRLVYAVPGAVRRATLPVLSIGNLTVGGTGKTTFVAWLARELHRRGHRPAVVTRGYKGRAGRGPLVVSRGDGPIVGPMEAGDEPYLLARHLPGTVVVAGSDRLSGTQAARRAGADVAILDDGFQHLRMARDLDVVLLDAHSPFGNYRLLPAGTLREPASGLRRADVVLITRSRPGEGFAVIERVVRRHNAEVPILRAGHRRAGFVDVRGASAAKPARAVAFCGIGNPQAFVGDLEAEGVELAAVRIFRDHHAFTASDRESLRELATRHDATLVTTEKDIVRLPVRSAEYDGPSVLALRIEAVVHDEALLMSRVEAALALASRTG